MTSLAETRAEAGGGRQASPGPGRAAYKVVSWALTLVVLGFWFVTLRPVSVGGPTSFIGVTGVSMEPTFHEGDMTIVHRQSQYGLGDIVAYRVPAGQPGEGHNIIHRIVGGDGVDGFTTKGDNNSYTDVWHPTSADVIGEVWVKAPNLARWLGQLRSPGVIALVVAVGSFLVMVAPSRRPRSPASAYGGDDA
ncbi:MAG: signal peptidase I [Acidimicrobiales bacterium]